MEGNKDEALRCIELAEAALASKNKEKANKFITIAKRLDPTISISDRLFHACENLNNSSSHSQNVNAREIPIGSSSLELPRDDSNYTEENVKLVRDIRKKKDYYLILGVEKNCSVEEIKRAYRKLSLKVHPDKNKAPGADEAFKIVSKAFRCLSENDSRKQYDLSGCAEGDELEQQFSNVRRRRRRTTRTEFYEDNFDPDEIFRSFFYGNQAEVFRAQRVYRARQREHNVQGGGFSWIVLIQLLPVLLFFVLVTLPFSDRNYMLHKNNDYRIPKVTEKYGIEYFVKMVDFDEKFPEGSAARIKIENEVERDYKGILSRHCHLEMQRRHWVRDYPTPHCNKLRSFGMS